MRLVSTDSHEPLDRLVEAFCARYANTGTAKAYRSLITSLFRFCGHDDPTLITEADLVAFCTKGNPANNTVYQRRSHLVVFFRWCHREGIITTSPAEHLSGRESTLKAYRRTYGKVQDRHPARRLTKHEAYTQLVGACQDGTLAGLRDELIIRLGLAGLRRSEIANLTIHDIAELPRIAWTGKNYKPRQATASTALCALITQWLSHYPDPQPHDTLVCRLDNGRPRRNDQHRIAWHHQAGPHSIDEAVKKRARLAGIGHLAPHDLRRTTAKILHEATDEHGAHFFDLVDIQHVLGHEDPATTMKSYIGPLDTTVLDRAAMHLD